MTAAGVLLTWSAEHLKATVSTGDGVDWPEELHFLWLDHGERTFALMQDIAVRGVVTPVEVALEDGVLRLVDGHHRVAACLALGLPVPVRVFQWDTPCREEAL